MTGDLLTIQDITRATGLEESLLRYYESEFPEALPKKVQQGGRLFFAPAAIAAFESLHYRQQTPGPNSAAGQPFARVIAITSGKGGVGKSNLALNLAIALQRHGKMAVVLDADMGMANIHLLAGLDPTTDILDILTNDQANLSTIILEGPEGVGIIPGGGGTLALADSSRQDRLRIVGALEQIEQRADFILVDTGAGMGAGVRDFLLSADELLFVLTPDITSLADGYGLLKAMHQEGMSIRPIYSVINMVGTLRQAADVATRFTACAEQFLGWKINNLGYLLKDATVGAATLHRTPYSVFKPNARISKNTNNIADALLRVEMPELRMSSAFSRYQNLLRAAG